MKQYLHWKLTNNRTNAAYWLGAAALVYAALTQWSWAKAGVAFGIEALVITLYSAVTHRYFVHRAYEANRTAAFVLAIPGVLYSLASPVVFSAAHWTHHAYADTPKDSHHKGWRGVFTASFKEVPPKALRAAHWFLDGKHQVLFRYSFAFMLTWWALLWVVGGVQTLVWIGLIPTFFIHLFHGLHRSFGHDSKGGRRIWWAEFVLPMGGDWLHDEHHRNPKLAILSRRWYEIDPGAGVIRLLRLTAGLNSVFVGSNGQQQKSVSSHGLAAQHSLVNQCVARQSMLGNDFSHVEVVLTDPPQASLNNGIFPARMIGPDSIKTSISMRF